MINTVRRMVLIMAKLHLIHFGMGPVSERVEILKELERLVKELETYMGENHG